MQRTGTTWWSMRMSRVLVLVAAAALLVASCGGSDDLDSASDAVDDTTETGSGDAASDAADVVEDAAEDDAGDSDEQAVEEAEDSEADEDDGAADRVDESRDLAAATGNQGDVNLSIVVEAVAQGLGSLGTAQQRAIQGAADGNAVCEDPTGERSRPAASQVELEIVELVDGCLHFRYDVADFRSFVDDLRSARATPGVIAVSPLLLEYRLNQIESEWPRQAVQSDFIGDADAPTGAAVTIALIDSGVDQTHPALGDVSVVRPPDSGTGDYTASGHGTIAAAIITSPLGTAQRGIAPNVTLLDVPADLCSPGDCGCDPCAPMTPAEAVQWSVDNGADIISMSFGYLPAQKPAWWQILLDEDEASSVTETLQVSIAYATASEVAMVAAAGNCANGPNAACETENQFEIPAGHDDVIGVGALEPDDDGNATKAWYSTEQNYVDLAAPGTLTVAGPGGESEVKAGTSFATPFVSAALAVLIGQDGPLADQPQSLEIAQQLLFDSASDLAPEGRDVQFGFGQLQIDQALQMAVTYAENNPVPTEDSEAEPEDEPTEDAEPQPDDS